MRIEPGRDLRALGRAYFFQNGCYVPLHRVDGAPERAGYSGIGLPKCNEFRDFRFPG